MKGFEEQVSGRRRKSGPRVRTGCITCRIRRIKCDEGKPACCKCTSTGRKCDGYNQQRGTTKGGSSALEPDGDATEPVVPQYLNPVYAMPSTAQGSQRERQLFHFYHSQSASMLSVYLNPNFWHTKIMQYSEHFPVVRQAVIAFGASHMYAINMSQKRYSVDEKSETHEQAKQYDKALRALRVHIESSDSPDLHVILICCALFFSCENGCGNKKAALQHLQNGLRILSNAKQRQMTGTARASGSRKLSTDSEGSTSKLRSKDAEVDDELLYVFSRLDCQVTLSEEDRVPFLDMIKLGEPIAGPNTRFTSITNAQRRLDALLNRLAKFLTGLTTTKDIASQDWSELDQACVIWSKAMNDFVALQSAAVRKILTLKRAGPERKDAEWQLAMQIQVLSLHHRCWWMLFLSSYPNKPSIYTMSPNPRAEEILDLCEFLGFSMPVRASVSSSSDDTDIAWTIMSETGVAAPLFVLVTKCTDANVRSRALEMIADLKERRGGVYDQRFLRKVYERLERRASVERDINSGSSDANRTSIYPTQSTSFDLHDGHRGLAPGIGLVDKLSADAICSLHIADLPQELSDWSKRLNTI